MMKWFQLLLIMLIPVLSACDAWTAWTAWTADHMVASQANANVIDVRAVEQADGAWTFHVTVEHPDTGWEDYADGWDVVTSTGEVLKPDIGSPFTRVLLHPHETEQPFTRSQRNIQIPDDITWVTVRAHDLVDGFGGNEIMVDLTVTEGDGFRVEHLSST